MKKKTLSFEEALEQLEDIVNSMEKSEPTLKELMENYGKGITLADLCMKSLKRAEDTMDIIVKAAGDKVQEEPLEIEMN